MNLNKTKYLCIGETQSNLKLDKDSEIEFCQEYKYLGQKLLVFERKILRRIFGPTKKNQTWRIKKKKKNWTNW